MTLIVLYVIVVFTISSTKSNCCDFISKDEWLPFHHHVAGNGRILSQAATKVKNSAEFKDAL